MIALKTSKHLKQSSVIRAMFEEGEKLRRIYGAENVFDFSLGNPDPEPPKAVKNALKRLVSEDKPGAHGYMNNAGYPEVRARVADGINGETGRKLSYRNIIMTCGAGGALNTTLKTILNPGEEVIVFAPFFPEYKFYIDNFGGKIVEVSTSTTTFEPDPDCLERSINSRTKAIILNSPNNPTGVIYSESLLKTIAGVVDKKDRELDTRICIISDEPYSRLVYDNIKLPSVLNIFRNSVVINSFSKSHSLPGERVGYIAVNYEMENAGELIDGLVFSNRILGYVNAPALFQQVVAMSFENVVDSSIYAERRDILYNHLIRLGFSCVKPQGAFYLFPKALIPDDKEFISHALKYNLVLVPGSGFGCPGYFRIAYCMDMKTIENSLAAFSALAEEFH
ncbi:MAG: aspartate aminotransferase [Clostridiales bacterium GWC2_40_7]|nr:MAG: aspartate aminotransferase [Clostridiales bacterium GWC2_40_7]